MNQTIKIWSNDWLILDGILHDIIVDQSGIIVDLTSSGSNRRSTWSLSNKFSNILYEIV